MESDLISRSAAIEALLNQPNTLTPSVIRRVLRQVPGVVRCSPQLPLKIRDYSGNVLFRLSDVAKIIADLFGDCCACNFNGIDEWLPEKCELIDACPNVVGVACWEQYLKYRGRKQTGHWIIIDDDYTWDDDADDETYVVLECECSVCGKRTKEDRPDECPNCGAKMEG